MMPTSEPSRPISGSTPLNWRWWSSITQWLFVLTNTARSMYRLESQGRWIQFMNKSAIITATFQECQWKLPTMNNFMAVPPCLVVIATCVTTATEFTCMLPILLPQWRRNSCQMMHSRRSCRSPTWKRERKLSSQSWRQASRSLKLKRSSFMNVPAFLVSSLRRMPWLPTTIPSASILTCWSRKKRLRRGT